MRRSLRYATATLAAAVVTAFAASTTGSFSLPLMSVPIVYGPTTSIILAHRATWVELTRQTDPSRKLGAIGGGVGAFALGALMRVSIPVGMTAFGLFVFGMAIAIADVSTLDR
jgi:hypothetical protein